MRSLQDDESLSLQLRELIRGVGGNGQLPVGLLLILLLDPHEELLGVTADLGTIPRANVLFYLAPIFFEVEDALQEQPMLLISPAASEGLLALDVTEEVGVLDANGLQSLQFWRLIEDWEFITELALHHRHFKLVVLVGVSIALNLY